MTSDQLHNLGGCRGLGVHLNGRQLDVLQNHDHSSKRFKEIKKLYCPFKIRNISSVTHKMTVITTLVNHIGPTAVNTQ